MHEIVTENIGYHKFCARWLPKLWSEDHKKPRMATSLTFLEAYEKDGEPLLDRVITRDESWVKHETCEIKKLSMEWGHTSYPKRPMKCLQTFSARKNMATVFWDRDGVLLVDFLECGLTINSERYCVTLKKI